MKKIIVILIMLTIASLLMGCSLIVKEEDTEKYESLKNQFHVYLENDLMFTENFHDFINKVSLETSKLNVKIKTNIYHDDGPFIQSKFGSGIVIEEDDLYYFILTTSDLMRVSSQQRLSFQITDYYGNIYTGVFTHVNEELELGIIRINKNINKPLMIAHIAKSSPIINEPLLLISYQQKISNSMVMGFAKDTIDGNPVNQLYTTITSDIFGNGGAIINSRFELVGIQYMVEIGEVVAISVKGIELYLEQYHFDINQD